MDADEALARQLQEDEDRALGAALQQVEMQQQQRLQQPGLAAQLQSYSNRALKYEDEMLQALALSVMPLDRLEAAAEEAVHTSRQMGEQPPLAREEALARELLTWFKADFFSWVDSPQCEACGAATHHEGVAPPTPQEAEGEASRTELHRCTRCSAITRFPRYNDPAKLLETRRGRCGEWANCFTLCLRAAGLPARHVLDLTDHVWSEVFSPQARRWIHLDPCEAAMDKPLLYEAGWGKPLSYVFAFGRDGAADVTRRYVRAASWPAVAARRTLMGEQELELTIAALNGRLRTGLPPNELAALALRDAEERKELRRGGAADSQEALPGRQTGSEEWKQSRGETGGPSCSTNSHPPFAGPPPVLPGTRFRLARDDGVEEREAGRLCGGAVRASAENAPHETAEKAFDGRDDTKWLDFGGAAGGGWLEYRLPPARPPQRVDRYALTSANDFPERDPRDFVLEGLPDPGSGGAMEGPSTSWRVLDERSGIYFPARHSRLTFTIAQPLPCRAYRLSIRALRGPANCVQLSRFDLWLADVDTNEAAEQVSTSSIAHSSGANTASPSPHEAAPALQSTMAQNLTTVTEAAPQPSAIIAPTPAPLPTPTLMSSEHETQKTNTTPTAPASLELTTPPQTSSELSTPAAAPSSDPSQPPELEALASAVLRAQRDGLLPAGSLAVLRTVLGNVAQHPGEPKYRRLREGNARVAPLAASPECATLLRAVGFVRDASAAEPTLAAHGPGVTAAAQRALQLLSGAGPEDGPSSSPAELAAQLARLRG